MNISNLKIVSLGLDEDTQICFDHEPLATYKYRGYINIATGMTGIMKLYDDNGHQLDQPEQLTIEGEVNRMLGIVPGNVHADDTASYLATETKEGQYLNELERFMELSEELKKVLTEQDGMIVSWAIEYDDNVAVIYGGTKEEIMEWLNRPYDESEFDED